MHTNARLFMLFATLALGSFALGAATTATLSAVPATPPAMQPFPLGGDDASVPSASTVTFLTDQRTAAPTF